MIEEMLFAFEPETLLDLEKLLSSVIFLFLSDGAVPTATANPLWRPPAS